MCVEKTPWELVIDFHGHTCPGIALGYRVAQLALKEMGMHPNLESQCIVKAYIRTCAVDAFQVLNRATTGRRALFIEDLNKHVYQFHFSGTHEILQLTILPEVIEHLSLHKADNLSPREKQNWNLKRIQYILTLDEGALCKIERIEGEIQKA
jgi:formylmethanofuran dehydrogenase subunit E